MKAPAWRRYLRFWRANLDADIDDELRFHFEERIEELMARGRSREAARQEALEGFGPVTDFRAEIHSIDERRARRHSRASWWEGARQDIRYALRSLLGSRGVALTVVITLALGIGANAAMFTFLNTLLLRPPDGLAQPQQLRRLWARHFQTFDHVPFWATAFSYPDYEAMARAVSGEAMLASYSVDENARLGPTDEFPRVTVGYATHNFLPLLGAPLWTGRFYTSDENRMGRGAPVAVVSYAFWKRHFADGPNVLGQPLRIGRERFTIIGVLRPQFSGIDLNAVDAWVPLASIGGQWYNNEWYRTRNDQGLSVVARLSPGAPTPLIEAKLTQVLRTPTEGPPPDSLETAQLGSIIRARGPWQPDQDTAIALRLSGVAAVVLLIACANIINLLLARAARRRREFAVRLALGMSRGRLAAMLCIETTLLALAAGVGATLVAIWGGILLRTQLMPGTHFSAPVFDWRVGAATTLIAITVGLVTGLLPARLAGQVDLTTTLKEGARGGPVLRSRLRRALLVMQSALCVLLLASAGALSRSLHNVETLRLGFDVDHIVYAELDERRSEVLRSTVPSLIDRLRALPGVERVASAGMAPMRGFAATMMFLPGRASLVFPHAQPVFTAVSPDYFGATGTRILRGRGFDRSAQSASEVVVSTEFARTLWPNEDPLGRCVIFGKRTNPCSTVVGVVENVRHWELTENPWPEYFLPLDHMPVDGYVPSVLIVRTSPDRAASVAGDVRRLLHSAFPEGSPRVTVMREILSPQFHPWRLAAALFGTFALLALCIAAIGVYSTLSYTTAQRTHEIGVRMALGAQVRDVVRLVLLDGLALVSTGVVIGAIAVVGLSRLLEALVYGTSARDPLTVGVSAMLLLAAAALAGVLPARRAGRVSPMRALRIDS